jgi:hypothetical protein
MYTHSDVVNAIKNLAAILTEYLAQQEEKESRLDAVRGAVDDIRTMEYELDDIWSDVEDIAFRVTSLRTTAQELANKLEDI